MWAEDGAAFRDRGRKRELLVVQDECSRFKINCHLAKGTAKASDVESYLRDAFKKYGAPLVLKHDGAKIFHDSRISRLLEEYQVVELTSPKAYPPFNGKKERSVRDIKSYERAVRRNTSGYSLSDRIEMSIHDLNRDRPRPVLNGKTAQEVFKNTRIRLPDRRLFKMQVDTRQAELIAKSQTKKEVESTRRKAVIDVLSHYKLICWKENVSTDSKTKVWTN